MDADLAVDETRPPGLIRRHCARPDAKRGLIFQALRLYSWLVLLFGAGILLALRKGT